mmetsp:Transcript_34380/g.92142  ORF Transcript_34380/g.92142 Transcript_34380/m.92142 type:complete len:307 (-) Transcript_34380:338-1258(-)
MRPWCADGNRSRGGASSVSQCRQDGAPEPGVSEDFRLLSQLPADLFALRAGEAPHEVQHAHVAVAGARHAGQEPRLTAERSGEGGRVVLLGVCDRCADHRARPGLGGGQAHVLLDHAVEPTAPFAGSVLQQVLDDEVAPRVDEELRAVRHQRVQQHTAPLRATLLHQPFQHAATVAVAGSLADAASPSVRPSHQLVQDELHGLGREDHDALLEHVVGARAPDRLPDMPAQLLGKRRPLLVAGGLVQGSLQGTTARRAPHRRPSAARGLLWEVHRRHGPRASTVRHAPRLRKLRQGPRASTARHLRH